MTRRMLIDATHPEETRVTVITGNRLEEFDYETTTKQRIKGNIYLAKVTRVEPSLQAAFVEYGGNRHGFLAFSEIHPDYYRIPVSDREDLVENGDGEEDEDAESGEEGSEDIEAMGVGEGVDEAVEEAARRRPHLKRQYKIQEVIKRRQVMLVQVVKEERGTKGAALTTYLSLAGRYCVVMPNTSRGGGVSRKIANVQDRKRLKTILSDLSVPEGMAVILRTAGVERSKAEIKRDFDYITHLWDEIRERTLESTAPSLIHEEGNLIKRAIRDVYTKTIDEVLVGGDEGYRIAKDFMKALIPSHAKKVQPYRDEQGIPLFHRYQIEQQLAQIHEPIVQLKSGGSIVIHQTEALVAIDVNSGKATRERHIEETALKTNLEAAEEVARQLRLRDLAGLIVIDFIDMDEARNDHAVERRLKDALQRDRARIQAGRISAFGLLEMSRQRLRPSLIETMSQSCPACGGVGYIVSTESAALMVTRAIEEEGLRKRAAEITVKLPGPVALYVLNHKRAILTDMEARYGFAVSIEVVDGMLPPYYEIRRGDGPDQNEDGDRRQPRRDERNPDRNDDADGKERSERQSRPPRRARRRDEADNQADGCNEDRAGTADHDGDKDRRDDGDGEERGLRRRCRRGHRGGRRRNRNREEDHAREDGERGDAIAPSDTTSSDEDENKPRRGRWKSEDESPQVESDAEADAVGTDAAGASAGASREELKPVKRPRPVAQNGVVQDGQSRKTAAAAKPEAAAAASAVTETPDGDTSQETTKQDVPKPDKRAHRSRKKAAAAKPEPVEEEEPKTKRKGWWNRVVV